MTIKELLELSRDIVLTDEDKEKLAKCLQDLDKEFCKQAEAMRPTAELLNRLYTL